MYNFKNDDMTNFKLRLLKVSDLKVTPAMKKPVYVFIKADDRTVDSVEGPSTYPNSGFTNLVRKIRLNNGEIN